MGAGRTVKGRKRRRGAVLLTALLLTAALLAGPGQVSQAAASWRSPGTLRSQMAEPAAASELTAVDSEPVAAVPELAAAVPEPSAVDSEPSAEEPSFSLYAQSAVLMDADTGRILYAKDGDTPRPMASTTKIMTCILALEMGNPEDLVEVSAYAASMPDVQLNIREGEKYRLEDLLYSLMLESHNDSAVAVAEHIGGSVEGFARLMNQKARDIGCTNTCFVTPNGLDGTGEDGTVHSTTAADLARIMRYCTMQSPKKEEFLTITRTASRTIGDADGTRSFYLGNHNALLTMQQEAWTGKTGFTGQAGYCYVAGLEKDGKHFTAALLGCGWPPHKTYKWDDMRKLIRYAFDEYQYCEIFEKNKTFPSLQIRDGQTEEVPLSMNLSEEEQTLKVLLRKGEQPDIRYQYPSSLEAPVKKGQAVGSASYYVNGTRLAVYPIYAGASAERITLSWCLKQCGKAFFCGSCRSQ